MTEQATGIESVEVTESTAPRTGADLSRAISDFLALSFGLEPRVTRSSHGDVVEVDLEDGGETSVVVMPHFDWIDVETKAEVARNISPGRRAALRLIRERLMRAIEDVPGVTDCGLILDGQGGATFNVGFAHEGEDAGPFPHGLRIRLDADPNC